MPVSKHRKKHKTQVLKFKNKQQNMMKTENANPMNLPAVRSIPTWDNKAEIVITGYEWEAIQNGLAQVQGALQASQGIMSRHIINGVIGMEFEKLNPTTLQYEKMSEEEKAPYVEDFKAAIAAIKNPKVAEAASEAEASSAITSDTDVKAEKTKARAKKEKAKVVSIAGK